MNFALNIRDSIVEVGKRVLPYNLYTVDYNKYRLFSDTNVFWIAPQSKIPAYQYNKLFFQLNEVGNVKIGLHIEKGSHIKDDIMDVLGSKYKKFKMNIDWEWHESLEKIKRGELDRLIENHYKKSQKTVYVNMIRYVISDEKKESDLFEFTSNGWRPTIKTISQEIINMLQNDKEIDWKWVNIFIYQVFSKRELNELNSKQDFENFIIENIKYLDNWMNV